MTLDLGRGLPHQPVLNLTVKRRNPVMTLPSRLTFYDASYMLDGGTTTLHAIDELSVQHRVFLPRGMTGCPGHKTGRLYFDGELVPVRSPLELNLLRLFKEAELVSRAIPHSGALRLEPPVAAASEDIRRLLDGTARENLRWLLDDVVRYVESGAYEP